MNAIINIGVYPIYKNRNEVKKMKKKYKLTGVGCMKCVAKIEKNLSELSGVENIKVCLLYTSPSPRD